MIYYGKNVDVIQISSIEFEFDTEVMVDVELLKEFIQEWAVNNNISDFALDPDGVDPMEIKFHNEIDAMAFKLSFM